MINQLKIVLANTYALYLKTQNYHWNVEGIEFYSLHNFLEEQYEELAQAVDDIAERIRALGARAPGSFNEFETMREIHDAKESVSALEMLSDLAASHQHLLQILVKSLSEAQKNKDMVTEGFLIDRMSYHEKTLWMLNSHLKK